jgi:hypothetical protein
MRRLNWLLFPVMYPIAVFAGIATMLLCRWTLGCSFPLRWYMEEAHLLTMAIILERPEQFFGAPGPELTNGE